MRKIIFVSLVILLFGIASISLFQWIPQLSEMFPSNADKASALQTFYTFIGLWLAAVGVTEYIFNLRKSINPKLLINNEEGMTLRVTHFPYKTTFTVLIANEGHVSIEPDSINLHMYIPYDIKILNTSGSLFDPQHGDHHETLGEIQCIGGEIPVKVFPKRKKRLLTMDVEILEAGKHKIKYYFVSDSRFFPKKIRPRDLRNDEPIRNLGTLGINVIDIS